MPGSAQDQPLRAELHPFRLPGPFRNVRESPFLVVDRDRLAVIELHQVDLGDQAVLGGGEHQSGGAIDRLAVDWDGIRTAAACTGAGCQCTPIGTVGVRGDSPREPRRVSRRTGALAGKGRAARFCGGGRRRSRFAIHPPVPDPSLHGVGAVGELRVHPLQKEQPWAVGELIEHAGRKEVGEDLVR